MTNNLSSDKTNSEMKLWTSLISVSEKNLILAKESRIRNLKKVKSQIRLKNVTTKQHKKRGWANSQPLQLQLLKYKSGFFYLGHPNQLNWKVILKTESLFFREHFPVLKKYMNFWSLENVCVWFIFSLGIKEDQRGFLETLCKLPFPEASFKCPDFFRLLIVPQYLNNNKAWCWVLTFSPNSFK